MERIKFLIYIVIFVVLIILVMRYWKTGRKK